MSDSGIRAGLRARSSKLLGMAAGVARHELSQRVSERVTRSAEKLGADTIVRRVKQAKIITENLSELKGAAMKAGQFLSIDASDLLPPEAAEVLRGLQADAKAMPFETVETVLREDLGERGLARLEGLETEPRAAASIGQVHGAWVDGTEVAVKVQYPGVAESIPSDLAMLQKLASTFLYASRRKIALDEVFAELQSILELEADYRHEAESLATYRQFLADDSRYRVPQPIAELCTERVLVMEWVRGEPLGRWTARRPPIEERTRVARALLDLYCSEFFDWGFVQTDPNPANFLVQDDSLVLLDFGATLSYEDSFRRAYVELLRTLRTGDDPQVIDAGIEFGILDAREPEEARRWFVAMMRAATQPFSPELQPFEFSNPDYQKEIRQIVFSFVQALRYTPPPRRLIFLHRKLGGLFNILKGLEVTIDLEPYWQRMIEDKVTVPALRSA